MRSNRLAVALLLLAGRASAQETSVEELIGKPDSAIQAQIQKLCDPRVSAEPRSNVDVCSEVQQLKQLSDDNEVVKQLAIWVVETKNVEEHDLIAIAVLHVLDFPPNVPIRVLAPCLDADDRQLRRFAQIWFNSHDKAGGDGLRFPRPGPLDYEDYLKYVEGKANRKEEVPAGFTKYIFDRSPGQALLIFAYANSHGDVAARLEAIAKSIAARQRGEEPEIKEGKRSDAKVQAGLSERRDIELVEHIVSNAIWLEKNGFNDRFQAALPEASDQLAKLAKHDQWWARLYVAEIMRQHRELRQPDVLQQLIADGNPLVSESAKSAEK
jgi:hypothetical protein